MSGYEQHVLSLEWSDDEDDQDVRQESKEDETEEESELLDLIKSGSVDEVIGIDGDKIIDESQKKEEAAGFWLRPS